jgi:hypothetical protein
VLTSAPWSMMTKLCTGVIDKCSSSGRLGISTQSSSPKSEEVPSDELLSISSTSISCLVGFRTDAKNPLILANPELPCVKWPVS